MADWGGHHGEVRKSDVRQSKVLNCIMIMIRSYSFDKFPYRFNRHMEQLFRLFEEHYYLALAEA